LICLLYFTVMMRLTILFLEGGRRRVNTREPQRGWYLRGNSRKPWTLY
jgi:hypothetical protein